MRSATRKRRSINSRVDALHATRGQPSFSLFGPAPTETVPTIHTASASATFTATASQASKQLSWNSHHLPLSPHSRGTAGVRGSYSANVDNNPGLRQPGTQARTPSLAFRHPSVPRKHTLPRLAQEVLQKVFNRPTDHAFEHAGYLDTAQRESQWRQQPPPLSFPTANLNETTYDPYLIATEADSPAGPAQQYVSDPQSQVVGIPGWHNRPSRLRSTVMERPPSRPSFDQRSPTIARPRARPRTKSPVRYHPYAPPRLPAGGEPSAALSPGINLHDHKECMYERAPSAHRHSKLDPSPPESYPQVKEQQGREDTEECPTHAGADWEGPSPFEAQSDNGSCWSLNVIEENDHEVPVNEDHLAEHLYPEASSQLVQVTETVQSIMPSPRLSLHQPADAPPSPSFLAKHRVAQNRPITAPLAFPASPEPTGSEPQGGEAGYERLPQPPPSRDQRSPASTFSVTSEWDGNSVSSDQLQSERPARAHTLRCAPLQGGNVDRLPTQRDESVRAPRTEPSARPTPTPPTPPVVQPAAAAAVAPPPHTAPRPPQCPPSDGQKPTTSNLPPWSRQQNSVVEVLEIVVSNNRPSSIVSTASDDLPIDNDTSFNVPAGTLYEPKPTLQRADTPTPPSQNMSQEVRSTDTGDARDRLYQNLPQMFALSDDERMSSSSPPTPDPLPMDETDTDDEPFEYDDEIIQTPLPAHVRPRELKRASEHAWAVLAGSMGAHSRERAHGQEFAVGTSADPYYAFGGLEPVGRHMPAPPSPALAPIDAVTSLEEDVESISLFSGSDRSDEDDHDHGNSGSSNSNKSSNSSNSGDRDNSSAASWCSINYSNYSSSSSRVMRKLSLEPLMDLPPLSLSDDPTAAPAGLLGVGVPGADVEVQVVTAPTTRESSPSQPLIQKRVRWADEQPRRGNPGFELWREGY